MEDSTSYNSYAIIFVQNTTSKSAKIWFSHQYSSNSVQKWPSKGSAQPIPAGGFAGPLRVGFNTGTIYTGQDYWFCAILPSGAPQILATEGSWEDPKKRCTLGSDDDKKTEYFQCNSTTFTMAERGPDGSCTTPVSAGNGAALVAVSKAAKSAVAA
jgi:hypothetical protein